MNICQHFTTVYVNNLNEVVIIILTKEKRNAQNVTEVSWIGEATENLKTESTRWDWNIEWGNNTGGDKLWIEPTKQCTKIKSQKSNEKN